MQSNNFCDSDAPQVSNREMEISYGRIEALLNRCNNAKRKLLLAVISAFEMGNLGEG